MKSGKPVFLPVTIGRTQNTSEGTDSKGRNIRKNLNNQRPSVCLNRIFLPVVPMVVLAFVEGKIDLREPLGPLLVRAAYDSVDAVHHGAETEHFSLAAVELRRWTPCRQGSPRVPPALCRSSSLRSSRHEWRRSDLPAATASGKCRQRLVAAG